jgi:cobalamin synthase
MNTPAPLPSQPPTTITSSPTTATMPTLGSIVGSVVGSIIVAKTGQTTDPVTSGGIIATATAFFTGLFHWLGSKLGVSLQ